MRTVGIDLAAEAKGTAVAVVDWTAGRAVVSSLACPTDDDALVAAAKGADRIGVDCPFGWPDPFLDFVTRHRDGAVRPDDGSSDGWRRPLVSRATDLVCVDYTRQRVGRAVRPLSVSADLLGHAAMRCAVLLARLGESGVTIDRTGVEGHVAEVYPAASLALWGVEPRRYKGAQRHRLGDAVNGLLTAAPWLDLGAHDGSCRASDHAFDAVIAALAARAVALGRATVPSDALHDRASREGWIALPTGTLAALVG